MRLALGICLVLTMGGIVTNYWVRTQDVRKKSDCRELGWLAHICDDLYDWAGIPRIDPLSALEFRCAI